MAEGAGELGRRRVYPNSMGLWPHPITPVTPARPLKHPADCSLSLSPLYHLSRSTEVREVFHDMREGERASERAPFRGRTLIVEATCVEATQLSPPRRCDCHRRVRHRLIQMASSFRCAVSPVIGTRHHHHHHHRSVSIWDRRQGARTSVIVLTNFRAGVCLPERNYARQGCSLQPLAQEGSKQA